MRRTLPSYLLLLALSSPVFAQPPEPLGGPEDIRQTQEGIHQKELDSRRVVAQLEPGKPSLTASSAPPAAAGPTVALPESSAVESVTLNAIVQKNWGLALVGGLLLIVLALRKGGALLFPALASGKGAAWLAVGAGTLAAVYEVVKGGNPTLAIILMAAASGFWSLAQSTGLIGVLMKSLFRPRTEAAAPSAPPAV